MKQFIAASLVLALSQVGLAATLEQVPQGEEAAIHKVTKMIEGIVKAQAKADGTAHRDAHAKAHGCVKASFRVNEGLPQALQTAVFRSGAEYQAWIRYSNGDGKPKADSEGDGRGMAVKLMGVPGDKLSQDEKFTQDFLMINHPAFFVKNAEDYVAFFEAATAGNPLNFFFPTKLNPFTWRTTEFGVANALRKLKMNNPLESKYWSMTPYLYNNRAMKYMASPCFQAQSKTIDKSRPNFLREQMAATLSQKNACFEFFVQFQGPGMEVENPTVAWDETVSVPVKVATITVNSQEFQSPKQMEFCENLSMNPWHTVAEHRPLGGINRARKEVYDTISRLRHDINGAVRTEPNGNETF